MRKAARARQRILAAFLPIAAVLYISCEALDPARGKDLAGSRPAGHHPRAAACRRACQHQLRPKDGEVAPPAVRLISTAWR